MLYEIQINVHEFTNPKYRAHKIVFVLKLFSFSCLVVGEFLLTLRLKSPPSSFAHYRHLIESEQCQHQQRRASNHVT